MRLWLTPSNEISLRDQIVRQVTLAILSGEPCRPCPGGAVGGFLGYLIGHLFAFHARGKLLYQQP